MYRIAHTISISENLHATEQQTLADAVLTNVPLFLKLFFNNSHRQIKAAIAVRKPLQAVEDVLIGHPLFLNKKLCK